jgi:hypothetical protein
MTVKKSDYFKVVPYDTDPDISFMDEEEHKQTKERWNRGEFECVGVKAAVELQIPYGKDFIDHVIESPGVWGVFVESKDNPYLEELFKEESKILTEMLTAIGIIVEE